MTTYAVTAASGQLGRLAVEALVARGVAPADIVATSRDTGRLADLADRGVVVRVADYDAPETLTAAFAGVDRLLLVSGSEVGRREAQHRNAISAAQAAGVGFVAYTSLAHADTSSIGLAHEHLATEQALAASGLPHALLRNSWYLENYTPQIPTYLQTGAVAGSASDGLISAAGRADYAEAAAVVLTTEGHAGAVYELGGDDAFTLSDLAAAVARASGTPVAYLDLPVEEFEAMLVGAGVPAPVAQMLAGADVGIRAGDLHVTSGDLGRLLGRPATSLDDAVAAALAS